jgi:hypothetical protein
MAAFLGIALPDNPNYRESIYGVFGCETLLWRGLDTGKILAGIKSDNK